MSLFVSALIFQSPNLGLGTSKGRQCRRVNGQKKVFMKCRAGPVLSITATHQELRTQDTLTSLLRLTIDRCHHRSATTRYVRCELACLLLPHTHSSHDSRPRTSWKTIVSQEDKLGQTIERNSQLIPGQKNSCIINHVRSVLICNFVL